MKLTSIISMALAINLILPTSALTCEEGTIVTILEEEEIIKTEISVYGKHIKVTNATIGSHLEIYSIVGIKVKEIEIRQTTAEYTINIPKGYYIIRLGSNVYKVAIK